MSTHIQHPDKPKRTRCGRKTAGIVVLGYGPFGTCLSCQALYEQDQTNGRPAL